MTPEFEAIIDGAISSLHPRARYARDVIRGRQKWSGADLRGLAKTRFGAAYAAQRRNALRALESAGGTVISIAPSGKRVTAIPLGDGRYQTVSGRIWQHVDGYAHYRRVDA